MIQLELLNRWVAYKSKHVRRLREPIDVEFEFRGDRMGHPSNFAGVQFRCEPAEELSFISTPSWSPTLSSSYIAGLEEAILVGLLDILIAEEFSPHSGCSITLTDVRWDDVSSSERAFYIASMGAAKKLMVDGDWY